MLSELRITARRTERENAAPGTVEVIIEVLRRNHEQQYWHRIARSEGSPEEASDLADQFFRAAQYLKRVAEVARRQWMLAQKSNREPHLLDE